MGGADTRCPSYLNDGTIVQQRFISFREAGALQLVLSDGAMRHALGSEID
jgi:hypothetical protein